MKGPIRLRWGGDCYECGLPIAPGALGWWGPRRVSHRECGWTLEVAPETRAHIDEDFDAGAGSLAAAPHTRELFAPLNVSHAR